MPEVNKSKEETSKEDNKQQQQSEGSSTAAGKIDLPAASEEELLNGADEVTVTETTKVTGADGKTTTTSTTKKIQKKPSQDNPTAPNTPKKFTISKQGSMDLKNKNPANNALKKTTNNKVSTPKKYLPKKPASANKPGSLSNAKKSNSRQRSVSPQKRTPLNKPLPRANNQMKNVKPAMNGTAFEINMDSRKSGHSARKPILVSSTRPPKIVPRGRSPIKSPKKTKKAVGGAWR